MIMGGSAGNRYVVTNTVRAGAWHSAIIDTALEAGRI